jgi:hypothetical protein
MGGGLVHWNGTSWAPVAISGLNTGVDGIWGSASNDVWVLAGQDVYHYDGGA